MYAVVVRWRILRVREGAWSSHERIGKGGGGRIRLAANLPRGSVNRLTAAALKELALRAATLYESTVLSRVFSLCVSFG